MSQKYELPHNEITPKPSGTEDAKIDQTHDFWLGFLGALIGNMLLYILIFQILADRISISWIDTTLKVLPLVLNIGVIIWFSIKKRPKIVQGILVIASIGFFIILCLSTGCFEQL